MVVLAVLFARAGGTGGGGHRKMEMKAPGLHPGQEGVLPHPRGAGKDKEEGHLSFPFLRWLAGEEPPGDGLSGEGRQDYMAGISNEAGLGPAAAGHIHQQALLPGLLDETPGWGRI